MLAHSINIIHSVAAAPSNVVHVVYGRDSRRGGATFESFRNLVLQEFLIHPWARSLVTEVVEAGAIVEWRLFSVFAQKTPVREIHIFQCNIKSTKEEEPTLICLQIRLQDVDSGDSAARGRDWVEVGEQQTFSQVDLHFSRSRKAKVKYFPASSYPL